MKKSLKFDEVKKQNYTIREGCNSLRTNIRFSGKDIKIIMVTSTMPREGKSTLSFELARSFAEEDNKTLLIDADMRKSVVATRRGISSLGEIVGLSHCLSGQESIEDCIYMTDIENMDVILAGHMTPNPTELLGTTIFDDLLEKARVEYDTIIIDCPPLGDVIDAAVIAPKIDGAIMVVRDSWVSYRKTQDAVKQLKRTGCKILGSVFNGDSDKYGKSGKYGRYGRYRKYSKYE